MAHPLHLWVALSPHGFGHGGMTSPIVAELRRRCPDMRLTLQTTLPDDFLLPRYGTYEKVPIIHDFGFRMQSASEVDVQQSQAAYADMMGNLDQLIEKERNLIAAAAPHVVLANVPFVTMAAAKHAGVPVVGFSSLNWADLYREIIPQTARTAPVLQRMLDCYGAAECFLQTTPAQPMTLPNLRRVGPVGHRGHRQQDVLRQRLGIDPSVKIGLIAFGGMDRGLHLSHWPRLPGWFWLLSKESQGERSDMMNWEQGGMDFSDLLASVDVVVTKSGYGTFIEAALSGIPVLYEPRPHWPEAAPLEEWLSHHTRSRPLTIERMFSSALQDELHMLFSQPYQSLDRAWGIDDVADVLMHYARRGDYSA